MFVRDDKKFIYESEQIEHAFVCTKNSENTRHSVIKRNPETLRGREISYLWYQPSEEIFISTSGNTTNRSKSTYFLRNLPAESLSSLKTKLCVVQDGLHCLYRHSLVLDHLARSVSTDLSVSESS